MIEKEKLVEEIKEKIKKIPAEKRFILANSSVDGIISAFSFVHLFGKSDIGFYKSVKPKFVDIPEEKDLVIIFDLIINQTELNQFCEKNISIINFDHHHVLHSQCKDYLCLNPKRILKKDGFSSSNTIYELFKEDSELKEKIERMRWLFASAALSDSCYNECLNILNEMVPFYPELTNTALIDVLNSKVFEISQIINHGRDNPELILNLFDKIFNNNLSYRELYNTEIFLDWVKKNHFLNQELFQNKIPIKETKNFVFINSSGKNYAGNYASFLNLHYKDTRIYIEYFSGKLLINSYFNKDIQEISKIFNAIVLNESSAETYTQKRFDEIIHFTIDHLERKEKQTKLF